MLRQTYNQCKQALLLFFWMVLLTGVFYPLFVTGVSQFFFPWQANGSLIKQDGHVLGSILIGQQFDSPLYFWSRPSATTPFPYNASHSSGSNAVQTTQQFINAVKLRISHLQATDPKKQVNLPIDLLTTSASGLDPEISPLAALFQAPRIAAMRHMSETEIQNLISKVTKKRSWHVLGEPRINVLELNLALDQLEKAHDRATS
jgi:K+-transporting ATPase ATPase C chain